jgi:hypothetical protein
MKFIEKIVGKDAFYISELAFRSIEMQSNNAKVTYVRGSSEDCKPETITVDVLGNCIQNGNTYLNRNSIICVEVGIDKTSITYTVEGGNVFKYNDSTSVANASKAIDGALIVNKVDGSQVYLNPTYIDKIEKPFVTTKVMISSDAGREEIDAQMEGNPSIVALVRMRGGISFRFSGVEARQILAITQIVEDTKKSARKA